MPLTVAQIESLSSSVILLMGVSDDPAVRDQAKSVVYLVVNLARAYTRGQGFGINNAGELTVAEPIQSVIVTASARLLANPTQASSESESYPLLKLAQSGQPADGPGKGDTSPVIATQSYGHSGGFGEWSSVEKAVLHQYRKRAG